MQIIWSDFASEALKNIYKYHEQVAGKSVALKIKGSIFQATRQLKFHPESGQIEEALRILNEGHRYLVKSNYKIVYKKIKEGILIADIFDTRQNPIKMNNPKRSGMK